jgi:hypothetical protein
MGKGVWLWPVGRQASKRRDREVVYADIADNLRAALLCHYRSPCLREGLHLIGLDLGKT